MPLGLVASGATAAAAALSASLFLLDDLSVFAAGFLSADLSVYAQ